MDLLLTPLVSKFLRQYVKRSAEGAGSDLKVCGVRRRQRSGAELVAVAHLAVLLLADLPGGSSDDACQSSRISTTHDALRALGSSPCIA